MKMPKEIYNYVEYELYHYEEYKYNLELEKERILDGDARTYNGGIRNSSIAKTTERKTILLIEGTTILSLERRIRAIESTLKRLTDLHMTLFEFIYIKNRKDNHVICQELNISPETFKRYKRAIIYGVCSEMGLF